MPGQLRLFVSSTMKDLANERVAVCKELDLLNCKPVNAEGLGPTGDNSWERIQAEIASCHAMILLLGERYGWIPKTGPGAELNVSVTELEVLEAKRLGIPILPFVKKLDDEVDRDSPDAKRRGTFRNQIKDWATGQFIATFENYADLAVKVRAAVVEWMAEPRLRQEIKARTEHVHPLAESSKSSPPHPLVPPSIPPNLREAVCERRAVLFAGSGMSLGAGLPSAAAFAERFVQLIRVKEKDYWLSPAASAFAALATDLESLRGRHYVTDAVRALMEPPQNPGPTAGHLHALQLFSRIITTNYDALFERAAQEAAISTTVVNSELADDVLPTPAIIKLHGSSDMPDSLVISEREILLLDQVRPRLWSAVRRLLAGEVVVVTGTSLRDPSVIRLFTEADRRVPGYFVSPAISPANLARLRHWNLEGIEASSDDFLSALAQASIATASSANS